MLYHCVTAYPLLSLNLALQYVELFMSREATVIWQLWKQYRATEEQPTADDNICLK